ncbi:MAG: hypothetical protein ACD_38C00126G0003 [uncultured bacterium]|uniref:Exported type II protein secretion system protein G n=1 Tax=Candidatus Daviesbacteria bacterium GW2011_GWC2_40_12 TaxID=1618431 RepID=A0A0G0TTR5_9BACT|nr:MAG: hypothetical protein ACD_38C00126G0003 [uncultured bacterium]KKR15573.1 MAG: Exported type II protein secretion system protein G [Candidatus Daviesbacteria bacterium GW2011_GWA2_39_33]KKR41282.1 MAG: Exported type II protein secretion system protein G [Candidatus Daviesbacteria bacterium GW2011_GWC2_40_12]KKS11204.1 MAG: Exported type II protein secretion system protein G [Parcubacteria group bacterium GW2011_GWB1_41_5]OGE21503.1 MAG: hypothetical protein A2778_01365 [Candidatus Daviesb
MKLSARGFTLIELLVVISILGLLSTIGLSVFTNAQKKARDVRKKVDVASIAKALEMKFKYDTQKYQKLNDEDFGSGGIPKPPGGGNYNYISEGRKSNTPFTAETADFTVCADLEADNPNPGLSCTSQRPGCFCVSALQKKLASTGGGSGIPSGELPQESCDRTGSLSDSSLVGYWKMDESSWVVNSFDVIDSAKGHNAKSTINPNPPDPALVAGKTIAFGNAGGFYGNQYLEAPDSGDFQIEDDMSISLWYKSTGATQQGLVAKWGGAYLIGMLGNDPSNFIIDWRYTHTVDINTGATDTIFLNSSPGKIPTLNTWYHIAGVKKGNSDGTVSLEIYVNGQKDDQAHLYYDPPSCSGCRQDWGAGPVPAQYAKIYKANGVPLYIGKWGGYGLPAYGFIDDVRIYKKALSAAEVGLLFNGGDGCFP